MSIDTNSSLRYGEDSQRARDAELQGSIISSRESTTSREPHRETGLKIAMVNGCRIFRDSLEHALRDEASRIELLSFASTEDLLAEAGPGNYGIVLLYIGSRKTRDAGVSAEISALVSRLAAPLAVLADGDEIDDIKTAIDAGARGYIVTSMPLAAAVEALHMVRAGGMFIPASCITSYRSPEAVMDRETRCEAEAVFTSRQAAVVRALRQGMANKRIAYELNMRESTVKVHVRNIMRKLNARNRTEVAFRTNALFANEDLSAGQAQSKPH